MARRIDTGALRGLRRRLAGIASPPFQAHLAQLCAAAAMKLVGDEFRGSHAPDGTKWKALASRRGKPLLDTGRLRASFTAAPTAAGFRIGTAVKYAGYHQLGTKAIPARPMLPGTALPPTWRDAFAREISRATRAQIGGAA